MPSAKGYIRLQVEPCKCIVAYHKKDIVTKTSKTIQRLPYRILSAMPAHIQYLGDRYHCDVGVVHVGEETILRQYFTDEEVKNSSRLSPKEIREAFLRISTEADAISFLRRCGPFREKVFETTMAHIP